MIKEVLFLSLNLLLISNNTNAKTLVVSDVDDTLKVSYAVNTMEAAAYSTDANSRFLGMSELLKLIKLNDKATDFVYLSNAPEFLMKETHLNFLNNGSFPKGKYIGRTDMTVSNHKVDRLREILNLNRNKYDHIILIGDNGQQDPAVYNQISNEFHLSSQNTTVLIHKVYSSKTPNEIGTPIEKDQVGFVTAVEAALELNRKKLISDYNTGELIRLMGPLVADEAQGKSYDEVVFSFFMSCDKLEWPWAQKYKNLDLIYNRVKKHCE